MDETRAHPKALDRLLRQMGIAGIAGFDLLAYERRTRQGLECTAQLIQGVQANMRSSGFGPARMNQAPGSAAKEYGEHARSSGGQDIVVQPIPNIRHLPGSTAGGLRQPEKEIG